jgi:hypothetical protein
MRDPSRNLMHLRLILAACLTVILTDAYTQDETLSAFKLPVNVDRSIFLRNDFYYGIKAASSEIKDYNYILFRAYYIIAKKGTDPVPVKPATKIMVGFLGFSPSVISTATELYVKPGDTALVPCVHNLLSDIILKKKIIFGYNDIKKLKLAIYDLNSEKEMAASLHDKFIISPEASHLIFIIWDQAKEPTIPLALSECHPLVFDLTSPVKFPVYEPAVKPPEEISSTSQPPVKKEDAGAKKEETAQHLQDRPDQPAVQNEAAPRKEPARPEPGRKEPPEKKSFHCKDLFPELIPVVEEFLVKNKINADKVQLSSRLNNRNDTLKLTVSSETGSREYILPIDHYAPLIIKFAQTETSRRGDENDPEFEDIIKSILDMIHFSFNGRELYFDTLTSSLLLPKSFVPLNKISVEGIGAKRIKFIYDDDKQLLTGLTVYAEFIKSPVRFTIVDKRTSQPINNIDIIISYNNRPVYSGSYNSGNEIENKIYRDPNIRYRVIITHPDYYPINQKIFLTAQDFDLEKRCEMEYKPAYNLFYVDLTMGNRMLLKSVLQEKTNSLFDLHLPFMVFVSDGKRPQIIKSQAGFTEFLNKIGILMTMPPNSSEDKETMLNSIPMDSLSVFETVKFQYFISSDTYQTSWKTLIDDLRNEINFRINKKPEIYLFIDFELMNDKRNKEYHYHTISN